MLPLFLIYHVQSFRDLTNFFFYMVGTMAMEVVLGISAGYLNNEMGFRTQYELITPQAALIMNFIEIILVIIICRFGSKEKDKKSMLHHALKICKEKGLEKFTLGCHSDNLASVSVIKKYGGILIDIVEESSGVTNYYYEIRERR